MFVSYVRKQPISEIKRFIQTNEFKQNFEFLANDMIEKQADYTLNDDTKFEWFYIYLESPYCGPEIIGIFNIAPDKDNDGYLYMNVCEIVKEQRGEGFYRCKLKFCEDLAKDKGYKGLTIYPNNESLRNYHLRNGFKKVDALTLKKDF